MRYTQQVESTLGSGPCARVARIFRTPFAWSAFWSVSEKRKTQNEKLHLIKRLGEIYVV